MRPSVGVTGFINAVEAALAFSTGVLHTCCPPTIVTCGARASLSMSHCCLLLLQTDPTALACVLSLAGVFACLPTCLILPCSTVCSAAVLLVIQAVSAVAMVLTAFPT